jgi:pyridoxamine 5'-phosphate oxidase
MDQRIAALRREYAKEELDEQSVDSDPISQFLTWFNQALEAGVPDANAMTLATVDSDGRPSARIVLLKDVADGSFSFFTNYKSRKARQLEASPYGALVFYWHELERQVRVEGRVERVDAAVSDEYFASRPRPSQIGAWASPQSDVVTSRDDLNRQLDVIEERFPNAVPRPEHWGGYKLVPDLIEIWQGRLGRLHDRICYRRAEGGWTIERLAP